MLLTEHDDREKAQHMFQSQEVRDATKHAGVSSTPEPTFLDEVMTLAA